MILLINIGVLGMIIFLFWLLIQNNQKKIKKCTYCKVHIGNVHLRGCVLEECPICHQLLLECECCYRLLKIDETEEPILTQGLNTEQKSHYFELLDKKGRIPFGSERIIF